MYRRMSTHRSGSVKMNLYYYQLAGAEARERLLLAAAERLGVAAAELSAKDSIIRHAATGRTVRYGEVAARAAEFYNELVQAEESEHRQIMEQEYGVTFIQPSEEELEKFRAAVADAVPEFEARDMWPEGLYEQMQAVGN